MFYQHDENGNIQVFLKGGGTEPVPSSETRRKIEMEEKGRALKQEYLDKAKHVFGPGTGGEKSIRVDRIDIPGNRTMIAGYGPVAVEGCEQVQTVAGPFHDLDAVCAYYKGRMAAIVEANAELLEAAGLGQEGGVIRLPDWPNLSEGSPQLEAVRHITGLVQQDALDNLCVVQLPPSGDPYPIPGFNGVACGCLQSLEPRDGGKSLEPDFRLLMVPECDLKYMADHKMGPFGPGAGGCAVVTYAPLKPDGPDKPDGSDKRVMRRGGSMSRLMGAIDSYDKAQDAGHGSPEAEL